MKRSALTRIILLSLILMQLFGLQSCTDTDDGKKKTETVAVSAQELQDALKYQPGDPFLETIVESQFFEISGLKDEIIEGKNGTTIVIPKGAFVDEKGKTVERPIKLELSEAFTAEEQLLSNLTAPETKEMMASGGMLYVSATADGKQLAINKNNPILIDMPDNQPGEKLIFKGVRGKDGNMHWLKPEKAPRFLNTVDMNTLDFLPKGFEAAVEKGLPYRSHYKVSNTLVDSLYYSMSHNAGDFNVNEEVSIDTTGIDPTSEDDLRASIPAVDTIANVICGVDPAKIKVIRNKKFAKTFIATHEFEKRLQALFLVCKSDLIDIYINNISTNLWELDEQVAAQLKGTAHYETFRAFAAEKLTNVEEASKLAKKLQGFYARRLQKVKEKIEKLRTEQADLFLKKSELAEEKRQEYVKLLKKREQYRMDKFGVEKKETGWMFIGTGVPIERLPKFKLSVHVSNGDKFERVHVYIVNQEIQSLWAMRSGNKKLFTDGDANDPYLLLKEGQTAWAVCVTYEDGTPYFDAKPFIEQQVINVSLTPRLSSKKKLKKQLIMYKGYTNENQINVDLQYQEFFYKEKLRMEQYYRELALMQTLRNRAFPCCAINVEG
jgi:hypothetical protein